MSKRNRTVAADQVTAKIGIRVDEKKHKDTTISLDGMTIEEALAKVVKAGPYPKDKPKSRPSRSAPSTKSPDRQPDRQE